MRDFHSINMYEMAIMQADDGLGRWRKRMWRSDYVTDQFHNAVSSLKTWYLRCCSRNSLFLWNLIDFYCSPFWIYYTSSYKKVEIYCSVTILSVQFLCAADPAPNAMIFLMVVLFSTTERLQLAICALFIGRVPHQQPTECGVFWWGITANSP